MEKVPNFCESSNEPQNFYLTHTVPSNSLDVHKEEHEDVELLTEENYKKEDHSELVTSGLPLDSNKETSWDHQNQEEVSGDTGDIKTIFEVDSSSISAIDKVQKLRT